MGAIGRIAAVAALVVAVVVVGYLLLGQGDAYTYTARFQNASQLVKGNVVQVSGNQVGTVSQIKLTDDGLADVEFTVKSDYAPLRRGVRAVVRLASLSGIANRYIDLQLGPQTASQIPDGGKLGTDQTVAAVDLDQIFNVFDPVARTAVQRSLKGFAQMNSGREREANASLRYFNPAIATSSMLFRELSKNDTMLERFITETSGLTRDIASRDQDVSGLIRNFATTTTALANQREALGESINRLPGTMRKANTTFVNLRATLDSLDPLVRESKPVVRKLRPLLSDLRPFASDARPTFRDLSRTIRRDGRDNDLIELLRTQPPLDRVANDRQRINGKVRDGAFPEGARALRGGVQPMAFQRPYAPDLVGWFRDFSDTGAYDAFGGFSRAGLALSAFSANPALGALPVPPQLRADLLNVNTERGRNNRCPGAVERQSPGSGTLPFRPTPDFNCDPNIKPIGR